MDEDVDPLTCAAVPLKVTWSPAGFASNPLPKIDTTVPVGPTDGSNPVTRGGVTVMFSPGDGLMNVVVFG
jgi:hypothetical protein